MAVAVQVVVLGVPAAARAALLLLVDYAVVALDQPLLRLLLVDTVVALDQPLHRLLLLLVGLLVAVD